MSWVVSSSIIALKAEQGFDSPYRTPALRPPPLPGRARPGPLPEAQRRGRRRRHLRRPRRHAERHPPRTRPRGPALVAVNLFHRAAERVERELDDNEQAQKRSQREQDGSEIRSVELERLIAEGMTLIERRNSMEYSATRPPSSSDATPGRLAAAQPARWSTTAL